MALPFDDTRGARDPRALAILAKTIYRELRSSGYAEQDVMTLASELLGLVATDVKTRRAKTEALRRSRRSREQFKRKAGRREGQTRSPAFAFVVCSREHVAKPPMPSR